LIDYQFFGRPDSAGLVQTDRGGRLVTLFQLHLFQNHKLKILELMKKIMLILIALILGGKINAQELFPEIPLGNRQSGYLHLKELVTKNEQTGKDVVITYGTLVVPENRNDNQSRLITLPIKKFHSFGDDPREPVFFLNGGPGLSNINGITLDYLLEAHDVVLVGYRGVDGEVSLANQEIPQGMIGQGDPFSQANVEKLGRAAHNAYKRFESEGIDLNGYNMIEVIDDFEDARIGLGYEKINLFGVSYGTRVAYLYGLRHPSSINRTIIKAVNPPGGFVWQPEQIDALFRDVADQWNNDPTCKEQSPDILATITSVLDGLPTSWNGISVDPSKVKLMTFMMSYTQKGIAQVLEAFVSAEKGDLSGLAFLCMTYDQLPHMPGMNWGDNYSKAFSADYDASVDYIQSMNPEGSVIGSPFSQLFALMKYGGWPIELIPEPYRKVQQSNVETLMISGSIDISTPAENGTRLLEYLPNGHQVILKNRGHQDIGVFQRDVYENLIKTYLSTGKVYESGFEDVPIDFDNVQPTFGQMAKMYLTKMQSKTD